MIDKEVSASVLHPMSKKSLLFLSVVLITPLAGIALAFILVQTFVSLPMLRVRDFSTQFEWSLPVNASTRAASSGIWLEVDLSQRQATVYRGEQRLKRYPIAIGQEGWETPTGQFQVRQMIRNPDWIHPLTDELIPADDPQNPLAGYWIGFWSDGRNWVGFHGTPDPDSVGTALSHGCIRMYNQDINELYSLVRLDTPVVVTQ